MNHSFFIWKKILFQSPPTSIPFYLYIIIPLLYHDVTIYALVIGSMNPYGCVSKPIIINVSGVNTHPQGFDPKPYFWLLSAKSCGGSPVTETGTAHLGRRWIIRHNHLAPGSRKRIVGDGRHSEQIILVSSHEVKIYIILCYFIHKVDNIHAWWPKLWYII